MKSARFLAACVVVVSLLCASLVSFAQSQTGMPAFASSMTFGPATVNLGNLNVHVAANVYHKPGRGIPLDYSLAYDSVLVPNTGDMGWTRTGPAGWMEVSSLAHQLCYLDSQYHDELFFGIFHDANRTTHGSTWTVAANDPCALGPGSTGSLGDGSGLNYIVTPALSVDFQFPDGTIIEPIHVNCYGAPLYGCSAVGGGTITDPNGNVIYEELSPNPYQIVDTTGETFPIVGDYWYGIRSFGYKDSNGNAQTVKVSYGSPEQNVQTNYGCTNRSDFPATLLANELVTQISYPDGTSENFSYEPTPGFPAPTTGSIAPTARCHKSR